VRTTRRSGSPCRQGSSRRAWPRAREQHLDPRSDHLRLYTAGTLRALIADFGFEQIELRVLGARIDALRGEGRTLLLSALRSRF
jgi:hypothetical protein